MNTFLQVFYAFFSSLLQTTAIPNEFFLQGCPIIGLFCLAPLYVSAQSTTTYRQSFFCFAIQTGAVHALSSFWLGFYRDFAIFTLGASSLGTAVIGGFFGLFFFGAHRFLRKNPAFSPIFFALLWTSWEWLKSNFGFLAYPWGTLSMTAFSWTPLTQIADITGTYGVSFLFALVSAITGEIILQAKITKTVRSAAICAVLLFALALFYGQINIQQIQHTAPEKTLTAILVQQNIDPWIARDDRIGIRRSQRLTDQVLSDLSARAEHADVVIWSEGVLNHALPNSVLYYENTPEENPLFPYIRSVALPFIIGGAYTVTPPTVRPRRHSNVAFLFSQNGEIEQFHAKTHLVPFGEYIPLPSSPAVSRFLKSVFRISAGWIPGKEPTLFSVPTENGAVTFAIPICFEDAFPDFHRKVFSRGSELFINITNDSWSLTRSAEWQHLAVASYRSIEFRQTMVRATNSGCSAVILPTGELQSQLPLFTETAQAVKIPVFSRKTTAYALFGDVFSYAALLFCAVLILISHKTQER